MNPIVIYFSRTGNTRQLAQAIAETINAPIQDMNSSEPSILRNYDTIIVGTPVEGFRPAKEAEAYVSNLLKVENKKAIVFCTYRLWPGSTLNNLKKKLNNKGYIPILTIKKKMKPNQTPDFGDSITEIKKALDIT